MLRLCRSCKVTADEINFPPVPGHCRACIAAATRRWVARQPAGYSRGRRQRRAPGSSRKYQLKHKYGLTVVAWEALFDTQGRRCALCKSDKHRSRNWHTDHDHATGRVRGILCQPCNLALGILGDSVAALTDVLTYLRSTS